MARPRDLAPLSIPNHIASQVAGMPSFVPQPYSPALPTALQQGFNHHTFPAHGPLPMHTPMQPYFPHNPNAPLRPSHHAAASIAHFAPGMQLPPGGPITPLGGHFPRPSIGGPPFPRNRRQPSIGGPPKAVLGGPTRKLSPLPPPVTPTPAPKSKKVVINLPPETVPGDDGAPPTRPAWARAPLDYPIHYVETEVAFPEMQTRDVYPPEADYALPPTIDVFLPGKALWEPLKNRVIEEKLDKMGIEKGSNVPHIFAPHARAASISSPADPALLFFKLNKLQQAQSSSATNSNSASPQPPFMTPSPQIGAHYYATRHGQSLSMAPPASQPFFDHAPDVGSFGPHAVLGDHAFEPPSDGSHTYPTLEALRVSQDRIPYNVPSLVPPTNGTRPSSRPDFNRGFGLDIPEVDEPEEEPYCPYTLDEDDKASQATEEEATENPAESQGPIPPVRSTVHSRHTSKLSAALSLISVGGLAHEGLNSVPPESDMDAVAEWTGSEDLYETDDESIGEWSNPSDEERARQQRAERRSRRRAALTENEPRRLPKFPRPPENNMSSSMAQDDDVVSNPSDDEVVPRTALHPYMGGDYFNRPSSASTGGRSPRPLPPLPHSRLPSAQLSLHDPAQAHSRAPSVHENGVVPEVNSMPRPTTESLNPFAKPFVFGVRDSIWAPQAPVAAPLVTHTRAPSTTKQLSAAAPEFKPGNFTFKAPPGVPHLSFPESAPVPSRPLPEVPELPIRAQQGREKRQRRDSVGSLNEEDTMHSFRFPIHPDSPPRHVESPEPIKPTHKLNPAAAPFTFGRMSREAFMSKENIPVSVTGLDEETLRDDGLHKEDSLPKIPMADEEASPEPSSAIHLDYRHPVSQNTVPAGLFKALVNNNSDERTRRTVRSRLGSREIFETLRRPSLDELHVESISGKASRNRLVTDPGVPLGDDVFGATHVRRRSSLPNSLHSRSPSLSPISPDSVPAMDLTGKFEQNKYEDKLEALLDTKLASLRRELNQKQAAQGLSPATEAMIAEVISLFRSQLHDSAARGLDESQLDARGELDVAMFKDVVQQGNDDALRLIRAELQGLVHRIAAQPQSANKVMLDAVEGVSSRTIDAVKSTVSEISSQSRFASKELADKVASTVATLRSEPIDYDLLTTRLSQAVKPHITQLIDLASDKRETAGLIVDKLVPLLPRSKTPEPPFDADALTLKLITEVRRAIAPIDAFEIKEQVADLVIERLDSRLAVRDKAFSTDTVAIKVAEGVSKALEPVNDLVKASRSWSGEQQALVASNSALATAQNDVHALLRDIPSKIESITGTLETISTQSAAGSTDTTTSINSGIETLKTLLEQVVEGQRSLARLNEETVSRQTPVLEGLPAQIEATIKSSYEEQREFVSAQLVKARGQHGQARVEKDFTSEQLKEVQADRERLKAQVKELQTCLNSKTTEASTLDAKAFKMEQALTQALARLKDADVDQQSTKERITGLQADVRTLTSENNALSVQVDKLEGRLDLANQEKDLLAQNVADLREQNKHLSSQQSNWDDLRQATEKIDQLTNLLGQAENHELAELRDIRDRNRVLITEHNALQKRFKELETKSTQHEKVLTGTRQSLTQSQQRCSEWEKRAKEFEGELEMTSTKLEQLEQTYAQLDTDYSMLKLQMDEKQADDRLAKDQERQLRDQITALETKMKRLQNELLQAKSSRSYSPYANGIISRPDSRSSTVIIDYHNDQSFSNGTATPPNQPSVWDSIHAPVNGEVARARTPVSRHSRLPENPTPKARVYDSIARLRQSAPSPTPSVTSVATLGNDGWWS